MKISDFINKAKKILNEGAGSEGMVYKLTTPKKVKPVSNDVLVVSDIQKIDDGYEARVEFTFPRDYGFALNSIKAVFGDMEINALELLY